MKSNGHDSMKLLLF